MSKPKKPGETDMFHCKTTRSRLTLRACGQNRENKLHICEGCTYWEKVEAGQVVMTPMADMVARVQTAPPVQGYKAPKQAARPKAVASEGNFVDPAPEPDPEPEPDPPPEPDPDPEPDPELEEDHLKEAVMEESRPAPPRKTQRQRMLDDLEQHPGSTAKEVAGRLEMKPANVNASLLQLLEQDRVKRELGENRFLYSLQVEKRPESEDAPLFYGASKPEFHADDQPRSNAEIRDKVDEAMREEATKALFPDDNGGPTPGTLIKQVTRGMDGEALLNNVRDRASQELAEWIRENGDPVARSLLAQIEAASQGIAALRETAPAQPPAQR